MRKEPRPQRATKIVATFGPASESPEVVERMVQAGLDVARINFSHAGHASAAELVRHVRAAQGRAGRPLAILGDLQGPKLRIGRLQAPLELREGDALRIQVGGGEADGETVSSDYEGLAEEVAPGTRIYLHDGTIEIEVTAVEAGRIETRVRRGGSLTSRAGMNVPGLQPKRPALTDQDFEDLRFAVEQGMDYLALSFVRRADDVRRARDELRRLGADTRVVAKIETQAALDDLEAIAGEADALMVARGDLGTEIGPENVPPWQRRIVEVARRHLIPSIVATEMLESMRTRPRPTRAEASDVAHAAWEGADAVMLSAETAVGAYPVETVAMMDRILQQADGIGVLAPHAVPMWGDALGEGIARAVMELAAGTSSVRGIVAVSVTGYSARTIAAGRPSVPILVLTSEPRLQQQLALVRGVQSVLSPLPSTDAELLAVVEQEARAAFGAEDRASVLVVGAMPVGRGGPPNFLMLHVLGQQSG